ncbi:hypothetical protein FRAAL2260 [Frankia alni ACN14a]|uniref:Uncharacterized protein n=1 Tax=Frankia alni (strain DSM 45986 / CECT 9034 / ACN14a) TaxID=326424 RepID=Q0RNH9_FRAAA|nr:hypothetical protein FRAAL2260 [Frankia alni ACN14a]
MPAESAGWGLTLYSLLGFASRGEGELRSTLALPLPSRDRWRSPSRDRWRSVVGGLWRDCSG